jgi:hypothetical protein
LTFLGNCPNNAHGKAVGKTFIAQSAAKSRGCCFNKNSNKKAISFYLNFLHFGALGSVGPTPIHPEFGCEKAEGV